jgi:hypothetical protein
MRFRQISSSHSSPRPEYRKGHQNLAEKLVENRGLKVFLRGIKFAGQRIPAIA